MAVTPSKDYKRREREIKKMEKRREREEAKAAKKAAKLAAQEGDCENPETKSSLD